VWVANGVLSRLIVGQVQLTWGGQTRTVSVAPHTGRVTVQ
jgi:hypothetical protein